MKKNKRHQTHLTSVIIVIVTVALTVFLGICLYRQPVLEVRFDALIKWLSNIENAVASLDTQEEIILCIFALFIAKCQLPIPIGFLCTISGMCFSLERAILLNVAFCMFYFAVKYAEGAWMGGGWAMMFLNLRQTRFIKHWVMFKGSGNPYILIASRLVPTIPLGMVSKLYGSMKYDFIYYICLSVLGFMPRLYIYTKLGSALYNPFSKEFIILTIIIVVFTGLSSLVFNVFYGIKSRQMNQTLLIYSQKEKYRIVL
ncbi:MAG: hypothetical protein LUH82_02955 [Clostridiales bacterium]|nr:hypothetical protein [Clostridiales bacterium]